MSDKVFMYGSCVSRDCLPYLEQYDIHLTKYVARQSIISAMAGEAGALGFPGTPTLESDFQARSLLGDLAGNLTEVLAESVNDSKFMLMDLVDERGGVWMDGGGAVVTNSMELTKSRFLDTWESDRRHIKFGTDEHFDLWARAIDGLGEALKPHLEALDVRMIRAEWASESIEGDVFPFSDSKLDPQHMNRLYSRYYDYIESSSPFSLIIVPKELCLTTRRHQWGIAPYHYIPECYEYIVRSFLVDDEVKHVLD